MALFLVFPSAIAANAFTQLAAKALGCDSTTTAWWATTQDQGSAKCAVVISDAPAGGHSVPMIPAVAATAFKTAAQLTGWVWPKDAKGNSLIPTFSTSTPIPNEASTGSPITIGTISPLP